MANNLMNINNIQGIQALDDNNAQVFCGGSFTLNMVNMAGRVDSEFIQGNGVASTVPETNVAFTVTNPIGSDEFTLTYVDGAGHVLAIEDIRAGQTPRFYRGAGQIEVAGARRVIAAIHIRQGDPMDIGATSLAHLDAFFDGGGAAPVVGGNIIAALQS